MGGTHKIIILSKDVLYHVRWKSSFEYIFMIFFYYYPFPLSLSLVLLFLILLSYLYLSGYYQIFPINLGIIYKLYSFPSVFFLFIIYYNFFFVLLLWAKLVNNLKLFIYLARKEKENSLWNERFSFIEN